MPKNVGDLGKFIVAKVFKKLPKVQKIAQSGHTGQEAHFKKTLFTDNLLFIFNLHSLMALIACSSTRETWTISM